MKGIRVAITLYTHTRYLVVGLFGAWKHNIIAVMIIHYEDDYAITLQLPRLPQVLIIINNLCFKREPTCQNHSGPRCNNNTSNTVQRLLSVYYCTLDRSRSVRVHKFGAKERRKKSTPIGRGFVVEYKTNIILRFYRSKDSIFSTLTLALYTHLGVTM